MTDAQRHAIAIIKIRGKLFERHAPKEYYVVPGSERVIVWHSPKLIGAEVLLGGLEFELSHPELRKLSVSHVYLRLKIPEGFASRKSRRNKKIRDSDLIRKLLKAGMSYRKISIVAKCSHGSVSAERAAMKREDAEFKRRQEKNAAAERELQRVTGTLPHLTGG